MGDLDDVVGAEVRAWHLVAAVTPTSTSAGGCMVTHRKRNREQRLGDDVEENIGVCL
jgi:hypothetical protein